MKKVKNFKKKYFNQNVYCYLFIGAVLISFIPLITVGMYNRASADDFNYTEITFHVWNESHSIIELLKAAVATTIEFWKTWQGLYSSAFLLSLQPGIFGSEYYAATGIIMLILIVGSAVLFSIYILKRLFSRKTLEAVTVGFAMSFLMVQYMPSSVEGVYWFNGAINYGFFYAYLLFHICVLIELQRTASARKKSLVFVLCLVNVFILGGGNHVIALMSILSAVVVTIICLIKDKRLNYLNIIIFLSSIGFLSLNISSPGTKIRAIAIGGESLGKVNVFWAVFRSMWESMRNISDWFGFKELVFIILLLPILSELTGYIRNRYNFQFKYPLMVIIGSVAWLSIMYCPPFYALGRSGADRLINIVYYSYVLLVFVDAVYLIGWMQNFVRKECFSKLQITNGVFFSTIIVLIFALFFANVLDTWCFEALKELYTGEAAEYAEQYDERDEYLANSEGLDVTVSSFEAKPKMLYFDDIVEDEEDWKNEAVSVYYKLKSIKIENE